MSHNLGVPEFSRFGLVGATLLSLHAPGTMSETILGPPGPEGTVVTSDNLRKFHV
jgi:hypothetical protein